MTVTIPKAAPDAGSIMQLASSTAGEGNSNSSIEEQEHIKRLGEELRCLVCQNQSVADSNSGLATDLRVQIGEQIRAGKSDVAIKQYMVDRYGEFILYNPPFDLGNAFLWLGPFLLLVVGVLIALRAARSHRRRPVPSSDCPLTTQEAEQALAIEQRFRRDADKKP